MKDYFDPERYSVIDNETGEFVNIQIFIEKHNSEYWERGYAKTIAEYMDIGGSAATTLLAYLMKTKTANNQIHGTVREISKKSGVATKTVSRVMGTLKEKQFLKMVRSGCYMLSPHIMRPGATRQGAMVLRLWREVDAPDLENGD